VASSRRRHEDWSEIIAADEPYGSTQYPNSRNAERSECALSRRARSRRNACDFGMGDCPLVNLAQGQHLETTSCAKVGVIAASFLPFAVPFRVSRYNHGYVDFGKLVGRDIDDEAFELQPRMCEQRSRIGVVAPFSANTLESTQARLAQVRAEKIRCIATAPEWKIAKSHPSFRSRNTLEPHAERGSSRPNHVD
jgi:hypothetical protein